MNNDEVQIIKRNLPKGYRTCFVPLCKNNSKNAPSKVFIHVPNDEKRKKLWFRLARRSDTPTNSHFYCCQDHFNLEEDMENFMMFKMFGAPIKIKSTTIPRFFECQADRTKAVHHSSRQAYQKLQHKRILKEILFENEKNQENAQLCSNLDVSPENNSSNTTYTNSKEKIDENVDHSFDLIPCTHSKPQVLQEITNENIRKSNVTEKKKFIHKKIQVSLKLKKAFRSIGIQCAPKTVCTFTNTSDNEVNVNENPKIKSNCKIKLPFKCTNEKFDSDLNTFTSTVTPSSFTDTVSDYKPSSGDLYDVEEWDLQRKRNSLNMINYFISHDPKRYIGVPDKWLWIIDQLHLATDISTDDIKLTLMKIKLNDTFVRLGNQFGVSATKATTIFHETVIKIASLLEKFIYFPKRISIKKAMPIPFRANYFDVEAIVDGFEIQIEKPTNPVHQALTWSEYKKCNTLKYLVSCSPDGTINYISRGYGGRISDTCLFEVCGIMDKLPENCTVMADRGFKQIDTILTKKNCRLVRPPSVSSNTKLSKEEARETKRIASLRIHIERVIKRIREFDLLIPHACCNHFIVPYIDSAVVIGAALVNLQLPIIQT